MHRISSNRINIQQQQPIHAVTRTTPIVQKCTVRYEIDAKRMGVDPSSEDALPRSREFKRIDSTYYVGWIFEGVYKYNMLLIT